MPTYRLTTRNSALMAAWLVVIEYRLHMNRTCSLYSGSSRRRCSRRDAPDRGLMFRAALADKEGSASLYHSGRGPTSFSLGPPAHGSCRTEVVTTLPLHKILQEENAEHVGLIKLDVEGAEELALRGALPLIASFRPCVIFEINPCASTGLGLRPHGAWELLENAGYRFFSVLEGGDLRKLSAPPAGGNVIAIHDGRSA